MEDAPLGSVICHNYTLGHHAPVTISGGPVAKVLGRTDIAAYIVGIALFILSGATVPFWWSAANDAWGFRTTGLVVLGTTLGVAIVGFLVTHTLNVKVRDLPRRIVQMGGLIAALFSRLSAGTGGYSGSTRIRREPHIRIRPRSSRVWVMPTPSESETQP